MSNFNIFNGKGRGRYKSVADKIAAEIGLRVVARAEARTTFGQDGLLASSALLSDQTVLLISERDASDGEHYVAKLVESEDEEPEWDADDEDPFARSGAGFRDIHGYGYSYDD